MSAAWPLFISSIFLPLVTIALLWRRARRPLLGWITTFILTSGVTGFAVLGAPWGWFGVPLRLVITLLFAIAVVMSVRRAERPDALPDSPVGYFVKVIIGLFFGGVAVGVLRAHAVPPNAIELQFPLRNGAFLIGHGGSEPAANMHGVDRAQRYALDILQLNSFGRRAHGLYPRELAKYEIFGAAVVSPCNGTVVQAVDGLPDNIPPARDEQRKEGNHVVLRCGDVNVTLAHLQQGSVAARPNDAIAAGAPIGKVGNSGNATEPHLHVHADRNGVAVPARFDGRWLVRNAIVRR
ncbi:MAG: hypothetical protein QOJ98_2731 [Acidobacteriota bacterium]|jgi:hypothetical protein|nr:hypothetical protein [Acidobacteriota bacterium]